MRQTDGEMGCDIGEGGKKRAEIAITTMMNEGSGRATYGNSLVTDTSFSCPNSIITPTPHLNDVVYALHFTAL